MFFTAPDTPLYAWQRAALDRWHSASRHGIIAAATGTGKTLLALNAIAESKADRVVIIVPTLVLQDQWIRTLRSKSRLSPKQLGTIGGPAASFKVQHRIAVAVINSARTGLANIIEYWHSIGDRVLLVVDECHWAGSDTSGNIFKERPDLTLGLSATPERSDDGFDTLLVPNLGDIIFRYQLKDGIKDGILSEITSSHLFFKLSPFEREEAKRLTTQIGIIRDRIPVIDPPRRDVRRLESLIEKRKRIVASSQERSEALARLLRSGHLDDRRTIVFNETIAQAEQAALVLENEGREYALEHSKISLDMRRAALGRFASGSVSTLVAVKALDEGIDVPDANTAVIVSGSLNPRQRIQRIGRIARASSTPAEVISLIARDSIEQWGITTADVRLLGGNRVRELQLRNRDDPKESS